jgi:hypothetical protein
MSFRYGMMYRPPCLGAIPKVHYEWDKSTMDSEDRRQRHGVIITEMELTEKEVCDLSCGIFNE